MVGSKEDDEFDLGVKGSIPLIDENTCEYFFFLYLCMYVQLNYRAIILHSMLKYRSGAEEMYCFKENTNWCRVSYELKYKQLLPIDNEIFRITKDLILEFS